MSVIYVALHAYTSRDYREVIHTDNIYCDVIDTFSDNGDAIVQEFPLRIQYEGEQALDTGCVCRDQHFGKRHSIHTPL